jgi:hypothetical protein
MTNIILMFISGLFLISWTVVPHPSLAQDSLNILVMGEDADKDAVPRNNRVFKRVHQALINRFNDEGFDVFDETVVTRDIAVQGRLRRSDAELFDIARTVTRPPIDVVVVFSIYTHTKKKTYFARSEIYIAGRILSVKDGRSLSSFNVKSPKEWVTAPNCEQDCLLETVGDYVEILGNKLGVALISKTKGINFIRKGQEKSLMTTYTLVFDSFTPDDQMSIEEYLVVFSGYKSHRIGHCSMRHCEYSYKSTIGTAALKRNLEKMLNHLQTRGRVVGSGSVFSVEKLTVRKSRQRQPLNPKEW